MKMIFWRFAITQRRKYRLVKAIYMQILTRVLKSAFWHYICSFFVVIVFGIYEGVYLVLRGLHIVWLAILVAYFSGLAQIFAVLQAFVVSYFNVMRFLYGTRPVLVVFLRNFLKGVGKLFFAFVFGI